MTDERKPLLTISTEIIRPDVEIDGQTYGMRIRSEMDVLEIAELGRQGRRLEEISKNPEFTEADAAELSAIVAGFCRRLLPDAPDEVLAKLKDGHRLAIVETFLGTLKEIIDG